MRGGDGDDSCPQYHVDFSFFPYFSRFFYFLVSECRVCVREGITGYFPLFVGCLSFLSGVFVRGMSVCVCLGCLFLPRRRLRAWGGEGLSFPAVCCVCAWNVCCFLTPAPSQCVAGKELSYVCCLSGVECLSVCLYCLLASRKDIILRGERVMDWLSSCLLCMSV